LRRFLNRRTLLIASAIVFLALISAIAGLYVYVNSPAFNQKVRDFVVEKTAAYTGTRVTLGHLRWSLRDQRIVIENLTLRGKELATEPPLVHVELITAGVNLRSLLQRRLDLYELTVINPEFHVRVDSEGRTNLPEPTARTAGPETRLVLSIDSLKITGGKGVINDRQSAIDFAITNLVSDLRYRGDTQILSAQLAYNGTLAIVGRTTIPYRLSSQFDFTRGTILAQNVQVNSNKSSASLQGRIDKALTPNIAGKLDYTGNLETIFLKHFLPKDTFGGVAAVRGDLEFSLGHFSTKGDLTSERIAFAAWDAGAIKTAYAYDYPAKQLKVRGLSAKVLDGSAAGNITVDSLPGQSRITLDITYDNVDVALLADSYPWDPKYRIYSRAGGQLQGWFEGRLKHFEFNGTSLLRSYSPPAPGREIIALPADGSLTFALTPGLADIKNSDIRFLDTALQATGRITGTEGDLLVNLDSSNLENLRFLYRDANGKGSFKGTLKGPLKKPTLDGDVVLDGHKYREWTIEHAEGSVRLDRQTELADLKSVAVKIGESTATVSGTASLDGASVNLRVRSDHIRAADFEKITKEKIGGILAGEVTVTSLDPIKVVGHVNGTDLTVRGHVFGSVEGDVTFNDPLIEIRKLATSERGAKLNAEVLEFNQATGTIKVQAEITSLALSELRELGVPDTIDGTIQKAQLAVTGTRDRPQIDGTATIDNLSFRGETFPQVRMTLSTAWPTLNVTLTGLRDLTLSAKVDLSSSSYPFEAFATFENYSVEKLANFPQGTLTASGNATFKGEIQGKAPFSGKGVIRSIQAMVREYEFRGSKPFEFSFDANKLTLDQEASFNGAYGTRINLKGSVGLTSSPPLDLDVSGNLDLSEITAAYTDWSVTGIVTLDGRVGGTSTNPNINGIARISNASLGHEGIYTTLSSLNGDLRFSENRVTFDDLKGRVGGGGVRIQGTGLIQNSQIEGLNVRMDLDQVRLRYPEGLRSSVTGLLVLRGTSSAPFLDGNLKLDSMAYRSDFESFLAIFRPGGLDSGGTLLDQLKLSVHVAGNRNISVQNELVDVTGARVDLDIKGTLGSPSLTGHVEATEGTLTFQGKRYEITRGNIDFIDPLKIDPVVDVQAETDVRDYRVILAATGRGDRILFVPRSDPPLPQLELISLIAGGKTSDELEEDRRRQNAQNSGGGPTSEQLFQGGAASILTDLLRSRVGGRLGLMGLDWIRVDPHFDNVANNPALRVTLSQQVSKDLSVTYSQDLSSTQQRIILIEYFLSKNLSIVASREENNETSALGLDIKLRKRF